MIELEVIQEKEDEYIISLIKEYSGIDDINELRNRFTIISFQNSQHIRCNITHKDIISIITDFDTSGLKITKTYTKLF